MKVNPITIGGVQLNNIFLAPMAGYTDYAFRHVALKLNYGLCFTELVSAKGLFFGGNSKELLYAGEDIDKTSAQLFGSDPYYLRKACESEELKDFKFVDINMGCPVPKVFKNGEGSALLLDIKKAENIVKECVKSGKNISIKIRTGLKEGDDVASEFSKMAEDSGAKFITIHGRVRDNYYTGDPDYNAIYKAKKSVGIPVIANGGIFTLFDAEKMFNETGVDGLMIARGSFYNPFFICELLNENPSITFKEFILLHVKYMLDRYGDKKTAIEFRKFPSWYFHGQKNTKELKMKLQTAENVNQIISLIEKGL